MRTQDFVQLMAARLAAAESQPSSEAYQKVEEVVFAMVNHPACLLMGGQRA